MALPGWAIALIVLAAVIVVVVVIVVPLVLLSGDNPLTITVENSGTDTFDSVVGEARTFTVTVLRNGVAAPDVAVGLLRTMKGTSGVMALVEEYLDTALELDRSLCRLTDVNGQLTYTWTALGNATRNNEGNRAWSELLQWTAFNEGTCDQPEGKSVTSAIEMTPLPLVTTPTVFVESCTMDRVNRRLVIQFRSIGTGTQQVTMDGTGGVVDFYGDGVLGTVSLALQIAPGNNGVIFAPFAAGVIEQLLLYYPGIGVSPVTGPGAGNVALPVRYLPSGLNQFLSGVTPVPRLEFMITVITD